MYDQNYRKIWRKRQKIVPKFSQNEDIFVKMGELFAHFDKNIIILRTFGNILCIFLKMFS